MGFESAIFRLEVDRVIRLRQEAMKVSKYEKIFFTYFVTFKKN